MKSNNKRALEYILPYKKSFGLGIFFNIFYAVFNIASMAFMMPVLKILFDEKFKKILKKPNYTGKITELGTFLSDSYSFYSVQIQEQYGDNKFLLFACVMFLVAFLLRNIFSFFSEYFLIDLRSGVSRDLRIDVHDKILSLPVSYFTEQKKGDLMTRITGDVGGIEGSILNSIVVFLKSPIMIIVSLCFLFYMSPQLTLFTLIVFPIMGTLISIIGKSLKKNAHKAQQEFSNIMSFIDETLMAGKIIKIFNAEKQIKKRFDDSLNIHRKLTQKVMKRKSLASPTSEFLGGITIALLVYFGGTLTLNGQGLNGSEFIAYIGIFYTMLDPLKQLTKAVSEYQNGEVFTQRVFEILDADVSIKDEKNAISKATFDQEIEFKNISFKYENQWVIKDFSLKIEKGQTVAFVGHSGSGKSTLANLITRFYDVNKGEILIDGTNIKNIKVKDYRTLFGMVTQDSILFNDSIARNISLGDEHPQPAKIIQAAEVANAKEFIDKIEETYDSSVGESGNKLSGGQKQRISIARAVHKNPPIMILDEATSALDTQSEKYVQDALENMMKNRTSMVIAHRLSTIQKADVIVVMSDGKIIEQGTHADLMNQNGHYTQLVQLQNLEG